MGLGAGIGLLIGARTAASSMPEAIPLLAVLFVLLGALLPVSARPVIACLIVGIVVGGLVGQWRFGEPGPPLLMLPEDGLEATIRTDPRVSATGAQAIASWIDERGHSHDVRLFLPLAVAAGKGDTIVASGRASLSGDLPSLDVENIVSIRAASRSELTRRTIRTYSAESMVRFVPGSPGSLTLGLLIGDDTGLSPAERSDLRASGLAHITAVSGWNVSVVVVTIGALFKAVGARHWAWLVVQLVFVAAYVWIVGFEPPIVRAGIMGAVALTALYFGRPSHLYTHLVLTAGLMATHDPGILASLSFQLSFLSMVGLAVAASLCARLDGWRAVVVLPTASAAAAAIATAPLLAAAFGSLPLLSVPANLLAGQLVTWATFTGMFVIALSWLPPVAELIGWLAWTLGALILSISSTFANVPGGHYQFTPLGTDVTLLIYAALGVVAGPFFPETRAIGRRVGTWAGEDPRLAILTVSVLLAVLLVGVVMF